MFFQCLYIYNFLYVSLTKWYDVANQPTARMAYLIWWFYFKWEQRSAALWSLPTDVPTLQRWRWPNWRFV